MHHGTRPGHTCDTPGTRFGHVTRLGHASDTPASRDVRGRCLGHGTRLCHACMTSCALDTPRTCLRHVIALPPPPPHRRGVSRDPGRACLGCDISISGAWHRHVTRVTPGTRLDHVTSLGRACDITGPPTSSAAPVTSPGTPTPTPPPATRLRHAWSGHLGSLRRGGHLGRGLHPSQHAPGSALMPTGPPSPSLPSQHAPGSRTDGRGGGGVETERFPRCPGPRPLPRLHPRCT